MWNLLQPAAPQPSRPSRVDVRLEKRYNDVKCYLPEGVALKIERGGTLSLLESQHPEIQKG